MSDYFPELTDADCGPLFRTTDPVTSKIAGTMAREFKGDHERRILEALAAGPGTKDEIAGRCGLTEQQVARRMHGLARAGLAEATGTTKPSASGRPERVYRATAASA
jgi:predicted ArsR family transcriptional regulator